MTRGAFIFLCALGVCAQTGDPARELDEIARIASGMVDGDVCRRIVTPRALERMTRVDPRDQWAGADNYDVNHEAFIAVKKTLLRVARLAPFVCDVNLWMPVEGKPGRIHVVIRHANEMSQFWPWGALDQPMIPEMRKVLETGGRVTVRQKPGWISVLAPVRDSMDDIVGVVEAATQLRRDLHENVK